jgi:hypothetical protein
VPDSSAVNNDGAVRSIEIGPLIRWPSLAVRLTIVLHSDPLGNTALTWMGVTAINWIGSVFPDPSEIVALTPPKLVGKGWLTARKVPVAMFVANMLTMEPGATAH